MIETRLITMNCPEIMHFPSNQSKKISCLRYETLYVFNTNCILEFPMTYTWII